MTPEQLLPWLVAVTSMVLGFWIWRRAARDDTATGPAPRRRRAVMDVAEVEELLSSRYRGLQRIGIGGMGVVVKAEDPELGRTLAIKVLHADLGKERDKLARFQREAEVLASLDLPGVVKFLGYEAEPHPHLTMEYVRGEPFGDYLGRAAPLPLEEALGHARAILGILAQVHAREVIHRDLKPSNLLITPEGELRLLDFGVAYLQDAERLTADGQLLGTPKYMAPEQLKGLPATPATDLYSVGVMLYSMLTAENPFPKNVLLFKATEDPAPPSRYRPEVSPALDAVVLEAMARRPGDRFASAEEFLAALP